MGRDVFEDALRSAGLIDQEMDRDPESGRDVSEDALRSAGSADPNPVDEEPEFDAIGEGELEDEPRDAAA